MATLTEVSSASRKVIKWGLISIVVLSAIPMVYRIVVVTIGRINPKPPPAPTVRYGKLPVLNFPGNTDNWPEFTLETIQGGLPILPTVGKVYPVEINKSRLLSLQRIKPKVQNLGFVSEPLEIDDQRYKFIHPKEPIEMVVNMIYGGISYQYDWSKAEDIKQTKKVLTEVAAVNEAKTFWKKLVALPKDVQDGGNLVKYLVSNNGSYLPAESVYEANFSRVDLFRANIDEMRVVTPGGDTSPIYVIMSSIKDVKRVVLANYQYSTIFGNEFGTYPLKGVEQAWKDLQEKRGHIAIRTIPKVIIRKVSLGYYEADSSQHFLQPVYIFEGDGGFMAYVAAIDPNYLQGESPAN